MRYLISLLIFMPFTLFTQSVSIGESGTAAHPSAILELNTTDKGLLIPRTDTLNITDPAEGLMIYQLSDQSFYSYTSSKWKPLIASVGNPIPSGTIVLSDSFPNPELEEAGFTIYGSYEQSHLDLVPDTIIYGEWTNLPNMKPSDLVGREGFWTGKEMLVWGGDLSKFSNFGAKLDPISGIWTPISSVGAPSPRSQFTAAWTGSHLMIFGGSTATGEVNDLFQYDPVMDLWSEIVTTNPPSPRKEAKAAWTGTELIIRGGSIGNLKTTEGYILNRATNDWRPISNVNEPSDEGMAYIDGKLVVVGGGSFNGYSACNYSSVPQMYYDLQLDSWLATNRSTVRFGTKAISTGTALYFYGGTKNTYTADSGGPFGGGSCDISGTTRYGLFGKFDPSTNSWTSGATGSLATPVLNPDMVYTGEELIYWGYDLSNQITGSRINTMLETASPISKIDAPPPGPYTSVWTGSKMLVWSPDSGAYLYDPTKKGEVEPSTTTSIIYMYRKD
ncbi:Kelch repeat-containing protein [Portibacter marinus]|uniref:Kelch repeat-containing protein n=1 Tax=Portibacter marinus TaxID=2898660 RepID=UPI001F3957E6|nr:hypothetical protein [Portibacter marinus]